MGFGPWSQWSAAATSTAEKKTMKLDPSMEVPRQEKRDKLGT
jgi:hypothetical protein